MPDRKKINRPTFHRLMQAATKSLPPDQALEAINRIAKLEHMCIRLIQIQTEIKQLETEAGYTDQHSGERHPGIRDEIEKEFIKLNMFDGVQIEDYIVIPQTGSGPNWVDPIELLRRGVPDEVITAATREGRGWTSVRVQRKKLKEHIGGAKF